MTLPDVKLPGNFLFCGMTGSGKTYCFKKMYEKLF